MEIKVRMGKHEGMDTDNLDKKVCHDIYVADKKDQKWLAASSGNYFFLALFYPKTGQHLISLCLCRMEVYSNYFSVLPKVGFFSARERHQLPSKFGGGSI